MTATLLSGASASPLTVWQACFLAMPVASATRSPTGLRRVCWRARPSTSPPMAPRTGPRARSLPNLVATSRTGPWRASGPSTDSNRIGSKAISPPTIRTLKPRQPMSSAFILTPPRKRPASASTRRRGFSVFYLTPPQHAAVFSVDEKTAIQALDRKDPVLPLTPGRAERHGFEYFRHGTLSLYAAFNTKTGEVLGKTATRHTSSEFVSFLADIVAHQPRGKEIHVIVDNLSAHKTQLVDAFLSEHPNLRMHFTPTYSSWLNQVELWFAKIERDVIARGVFPSVPDLKRKLMRYIRKYNEQPKSVKWKYFDPTRRITPDSIITVHYVVP